MGVKSRKKKSVSADEVNLNPRIRVGDAASLSVRVGDLLAGNSRQLTEMKDELACLRREIQELKEMSQEKEENLGPIIPLEIAAEKFFNKSPKIVLGWVSKGLVRATKMPDGNRGHYYYFITEQLIEDLEANFTDI